MERIINSVEYTDTGMKKCIRELLNRYSFLSSFSIGQSCMGREIPALKLGSGNYCLYTGGFSGTSRITTNILLMFVEEMCSCIEKNTAFEGININKATEKNGLIIVPRINPDGAEISLCGAIAAGAYTKEIKRISKGNTENWCANLRGVEINRNFSSGWYNLRKTQRAAGVFAPSPCGYGGIYPESEPETAALISLCEKFKIRHSLSLLEGEKVIYWQYDNKEPKNSEKMASILCETSGYHQMESGSFSAGGSFKDWFIENLNLPAFNVHINKSEVLLSENIYKEIRKMLVINAII